MSSLETTLHPAAEIDALRKYQSLSYELNPLLWRQAGLSGEQLAQALLLDQAIARRRSSAPMTLFRGASWRLGHIPRGSVIAIPAFTSTTRHVGYTRQFMLPDCLPAARITIRCPTGIHYAAIGDLAGLASDESEVLLGRGRRYRVEDTRCTTEPSGIQALVGPDPQRLHSEVWDVTLTALLGD